MLYTALRILDWTYKFKTWIQEGEINWLKKVNIFVGQNNSGKSRFMRGIFANKTDIQAIRIRDYITEKCIECISLLREYTNRLQSNPNSADYGQVVNAASTNIDQLVTVTYTDQASQNIATNVLLWFFNLIPIIQDSNLKEYLTQLQQELSIDTTDPNPIRYEFHKKVVYIPLLRWLKNPILKSISDDIYAKRTVFDYFTNSSNWTNESFDNQKLETFYNERKFELFSGLNLYEDIRKMKNWEFDEKEKIKAFEKFLWENFFNWEIIEFTARYNSDVLAISIGWWKNDRLIYDIWDGIQSIIICIFPLFKYKDENVLFFIEEPEIGIHPWMQRILLDTLTKWVVWQWWKHQIFFTTHSNHLLDIALDEDISKEISIYQFRDHWDMKYITNISQNKEVLDLLWVRNSSVFLSNCIIWVEWISDRIYIQKWLELYKESRKNEEWFQKFEEDKNFSILEYGWGNVTHFNFWDPNKDIQTMNINGINKNNFILADNDWYIDYANETVDPVVFSDIKKKRLRLRWLKKQMTLDDWVINFYAETPEIENLISYTQYNQYFSKYKGINWQLKPTIWNETKFNSKTISDDIWDILKNIFIELKTWKISDNFSKWKDISIIWDKWEIANRMTEFFTSFEELSDWAKILTKKLYEFIKANNSN